jgi:hypothetical protein
MDEECRYCGKQFQDLEAVMRHQETDCAARKAVAKEVRRSLLKEKNNGALSDVQLRSGRDRRGKKPARRYTGTAYSSIT